MYDDCIVINTQFDMKVKFLQKDTRSAEFSFVAKYSEVPHTYDKYHYHKEYELAFQIENQGTRFVGDSIRRFTSGDLVLIAPNIPHYWHSDDMYYEDSGKSVKLVVFHFVDDCFGKDFFNIPEMSAAKSLLEKARQGIQITGDLAEEIGQEMIRIVNETGWKRISGLISILNKIGEASNINLLTSVGFSDSLHKSHNEKKITGIYNYIVENHFRNITLDEIASFAHMNSSAFCRYFKEAPQKHFLKC